MMISEKFNVRQMQAYAALCLSAFCDKLGIKHDAIDELIFHLLSIMNASDLTQWEQAGAGLSITGRGDVIPQSVEVMIPTENLKLFNSLVEICVEVGLIDMYGDLTEQPYMFLEKCIELIKSYDVQLPTPEHLNKYDRGSSWGEAISESELSDMLELYGVSFS